MLCHISAHPSHGKFHGSKFVLGVVAQQFQFRGTQVQERGKSDAFSIFNIHIKLKLLLCECICQCICMCVPIDVT